MDLFQSFRVEQLVEQFVYYSDPAHLLKYQTQFLRYPFIVEKWQDGYVKFFDDTLTYKDLNTGKSFVIRTVRNDNKDYDCFKTLYDIGEQTGKFRFSKLVYRELIRNDSLEYMEFDSPTGEHGLTYSAEFLTTPIPDHDAHFRTYVDQVADLLKVVDSIIVNKQVGYPTPDELGFLPGRLKDSTGYYWAPVINWGCHNTRGLVWIPNKGHTVSQLFAFLRGQLDFAISIDRMESGIKGEILNYAGLKWEL
jgi:hypothetical protein